MLSTAPGADPAARRDSEAVVLHVTRAAGSAFAPSAELLADFTAGRLGWRQFERRYTEEMRALYRADPQLWIDLVEQAALDVGDVVLVCDECGPERPGAGEAFARCHRRLLKDLLRRRGHRPGAGGRPRHPRAGPDAARGARARRCWRPRASP